MPNTQKHRGANPKDFEAFREKNHLALKNAVSDMSWLLSKGYASKASLMLVGDRFALTDRQRKAVNHCVANEQSIMLRKEKEIQPSSLNTPTLLIDGYNLLITIECALSGAPLFVGLDGCLRDIASIHSTYKKVEETLPALELIGNVLMSLNIQETIWILDAPISNSGRLKGLMEEVAQANQWNWTINLEKNADQTLADQSQEHQLVVASADSWVIENSWRWTNLCAYSIATHIPSAWIIDVRH